MERPLIALETRDLSKAFGTKLAVDHLSWSVPEGSLYGFIGPNGAGKTTTFSMLAGFLRPTGGEVWIRGERLPPVGPRAGKLVVLPQDAQLPKQWNVREALTMLARLGGRSREDAQKVVTRALEKVGLLGESESKRASQLSHGQKRRVAIAQTLIGPENEIILLDEPTSGLDPRVAIEVRDLIKEFHKERTIIISSHNLLELESMCDHIGIIDKGKLVFSGTIDTLKKSAGLLKVELMAPVHERAGQIIAALKGKDFIANVELNEETTLLSVRFSESADGSTDARVNEVLKLLLEQGLSIKGMERGERLEQAFLQETRSSKLP